MISKLRDFLCWGKFIADGTLSSKSAPFEMTGNLCSVQIKEKYACRNKKRREKQKINTKKRSWAVWPKMMGNLSGYHSMISHTHVPWSVNSYRSASFLSVYMSYSGKACKSWKFEQGGVFPFIWVKSVWYGETPYLLPVLFLHSSNEVQIGNWFNLGLSPPFWSPKSLWRICLRGNSLLSSIALPRVEWS